MSTPTTKACVSVAIGSILGHVPLFPSLHNLSKHYLPLPVFSFQLRRQLLVALSTSHSLWWQRQCSVLSYRTQLSVSQHSSDPYLSAVLPGKDIRIFASVNADHSWWLACAALSVQLYGSVILHNESCFTIIWLTVPSTLCIKNTQSVADVQ